MRDVKGVARRDERPRIIKHKLSAQFFFFIFDFLGGSDNFSVLMNFHCSNQPSFQPQQAAVFRQMKAFIHQLYKVSNQLVSVMRPLAAKEPEISLRSWWRLKTRAKGFNSAGGEKR